MERGVGITKISKMQFRNKKYYAVKNRKDIENCQKLMGRFVWNAFYSVGICILGRLGFYG